MTFHGLLSLLLSTTVLGDPFCAKGIAWPAANMSDNAEVEVILAQAPLLSYPGSIFGGKLGTVGMYHTALVLKQQVNSSKKSVRYWTLEFDAADGMFNAALPTVVKGTAGKRESLEWHAQARFCLTEDSKPLWGRSHWTKTFKVAAALNKTDVNRVFQELVLPYNSSKEGDFPQYQLWGISPDLADHKISDISCGTGVSWVLHHIVSVLGKPAQEGMRNFHISSLNLKAYQLLPVNSSDDEEWHAVVGYYMEQIEFVHGNGKHGPMSLLSRLFDFWALTPMLYVHDANTGSYYKVVGNGFPYVRGGFPWFSGVYLRAPLVAPDFPAPHRDELGLVI